MKKWQQKRAIGKIGSGEWNKPGYGLILLLLNRYMWRYIINDYIKWRKSTKIESKLSTSNQKKQVTKKIEVTERNKIIFSEIIVYIYSSIRWILFFNFWWNIGRFVVISYGIFGGVQWLSLPTVIGQRNTTCSNIRVWKYFKSLIFGGIRPVRMWAIFTPSLTLFAHLTHQFISWQNQAIWKATCMTMTVYYYKFQAKRTRIRNR